MVEPQAQDERTWTEASTDDPVLPPAPANQAHPHDGGMALAPPARNASARALRRLAGRIRALFR